MTADHQPSDPLSRSLIQAWLEAEGSEQRRQLLRSRHSEISDASVQAMKDAASERLRQNPRQAAELAESILFAADLSGRPLHRAWGLMARGNAERYLARLAEAIDCYDEARSICLAEDEVLEAARSQVGKILALSYLGRYEEALRLAEEIRQVFEDRGELVAAGRVDNQAGITASKQGNYGSALSLFDRALALFEQAGEAGLADRVYAELNRAVVLRSLDQFARAKQASLHARRMALQRGMDVVAARADQSLAITYYFLGQYNQALKLLDRARQVFEQKGLGREVLIANLFATNCYLALNQHARVLELAQDAETKLARLGLHYEVAWAAYGCAQAHMQLGQIEAAGDALRRARLGFAEIKNHIWLGMVDVQSAALSLRIGDPQSALASAQRASQVFAEQELMAERAQADLIAAEALLALARDEEAARLSSVALRLGREMDVPWLVYQAHHAQGRLAEIAGDREGALQHYEACADGVERLRRQVAIELRSGFLADKGEIYEDLVYARLGNDDAELALLAVERAKSRALVELLAHDLDVRVKVRRKSDRDLVAEIERLRRECQWYYNRLNPFGEWETAEEGRSPADEDRLREELQNREKQLADKLLELQVRNADYTRDTGLWQIQAESPQPYLDERTLLVEYYVARGEVLAFSINREGIAVHRRLTTLSRLHRLLSLLHLNLNSFAPSLLAQPDAMENERANLDGLLSGLYAALVRPLAERLAAFEQLIIVPHGPLHYLPFHALFDGEHYLLEQHEISYLPSSSLLRLPTHNESDRRSAPSALVVGYSLHGALPHALSEAEQVGAQLSGTILLEEEATRANLEAQIATAGIVHLATHGEFRPNAPLFSSLYLADGPLTAIDVFNLELNASLVTLSACQSGASAVGGGDELVGFSRAFLYAGAASLLMSVWRVEDQATARLMNRFYRALLQGLRKPAALRQAQLALRHGEEGDRYGHPYFWAPFFLAGDRGQVV
jgi:hypothetical protein